MTTQTTATTARRARARWPGAPLTHATPARVDAWWRAANCHPVGQISLLDAHLDRVIRDRVIRERDQSTLHLTGPGHGGPGLVANAYLDGTHSQVRGRVWPDAGETGTEASGPTYSGHGAGTTATEGDDE